MISISANISAQKESNTMIAMRDPDVAPDECRIVSVAGMTAGE